MGRLSSRLTPSSGEPRRSVRSLTKTCWRCWASGPPSPASTAPVTPVAAAPLDCWPRPTGGWRSTSPATRTARPYRPGWERPHGADVWASVADAARSCSVAQLVEGAAPLGLPVAGVGEVKAARSAAGPVVVTRASDAAVLGDTPLVVDLSSLWAGPLCARLLRQQGARVIKVESWARPDGARRGPAAFFQLMHAGAQFVGLDLAAPSGRHALRALLARADVVIEASRPRALRQLGIDAASMMAEEGPRVWISITGYGRDRDRVAFGDDAAAAGGLLAWDGRGPCFAADAVADPLAGVAAAAAATEALAAGGRWILDVALARVAAHVARERSRSVLVPGPRITTGRHPAPAGPGRRTSRCARLGPTTPAWPRNWESPFHERPSDQAGRGRRGPRERGRRRRQDRRRRPGRDGSAWCPDGRRGRGCAAAGAARPPRTPPGAGRLRPVGRRQPGDDPRSGPLCRRPDGGGRPVLQAGSGSGPPATTSASPASSTGGGSMRSSAIARCGSSTGPAPCGFSTRLLSRPPVSSTGASRKAA